MQRKLTTLILCMTFISLMAQEFTVKNFALAEGDQTASTQRRNDNNGDACALIKVQLARPGAEFLGNVMGDTPYSKSEYFVYMSKGSKMLEIRSEGCLPIRLLFGDFGISGVESLKTYVLSVSLPNTKEEPKGKKVTSYFVLSVVPNDATVILDGETLSLDQGGKLIRQLTLGEHHYQLSCDGYLTKTGSFLIGSEKVSLREYLQKASTKVTVTCATLGSKLYANNEQIGTGSVWSGSLNPGKYTFEARRDGFVSQQITVTVEENQTMDVKIPALMAITGQLDVNYSPKDAEVWIDGEMKGMSSNVFQDVIVGSHRVEIRKDGYQSHTSNVFIIEGETTMLAGNLVEASVANANSILSYSNMDIRTLKDMAEKGDSQAQFLLGDIYYYGKKGVSKDFAEALKWYQKSAMQGNPSAQNGIGWMYENGFGVLQDYAEAVNWYYESAKSGNSKGQNNLGHMYEMGKGIPKDIDEAIKWYRKSAEQGDVTGQSNLGIMYLNNYDYSEAVIWFQKAADQGFAVSQFYLGLMNEKGWGVPVNINQAKEWYRKASLLGNENAKMALKRFGN